MKLKARPIIIVAITEILFLVVTWIIFGTYTYQTIPDLKTEAINIERYYPYLKTDKVIYKEYLPVTSPINLNQSDFNGAVRDFDATYLLVTWPGKSDRIRIILWGTKKINNKNVSTVLSYTHSSVIQADLSKSIKKSNFTISTRKVRYVYYNVKKHTINIFYKKDLNSGCWYLLVWFILCCVAILIPLWIKVNGGQK